MHLGLLKIRLVWRRRQNQGLPWRAPRSLPVRPRRLPKRASRHASSGEAAAAGLSVRCPCPRDACAAQRQSQSHVAD